MLNAYREFVHLSRFRVLFILQITKHASLHQLLRIRHLTLTHANITVIMSPVEKHLTICPGMKIEEEYEFIAYAFNQVGSMQLQ